MVNNRRPSLGRGVSRDFVLKTLIGQSFRGSRDQGFSPRGMKCVLWLHARGLRPPLAGRLELKGRLPNLFLCRMAADEGRRRRVLGPWEGLEEGRKKPPEGAAPAIRMYPLGGCSPVGALLGDSPNQSCRILSRGSAYPPASQVNVQPSHGARTQGPTPRQWFSGFCRVDGQIASASPSVRASVMCF